MLLHYLRDRQSLEESVMTRLEEKLRAQFAPEMFPRSVSAKKVIMSLWDQTTAPESKGVLRLIMDISRRAWSGSGRAKEFYREQQKLWVKLLLNYFPNEALIEELLHLFQGSTLVYLVTGDSRAGRRALMRMLSRGRQSSKS